MIATASLACFLGAVVVARWARPGPYEVAAPRFSIQIAARAFDEPSVRLANLGYLGHMWELFAMWTWGPLFFAASLAAAGLTDPAVASLAAFVAIGAGVVGCVVAGAVADRYGRALTTIVAMVTSGTCAVLIGLAFGAAVPTRARHRHRVGRLDHRRLGAVLGGDLGAGATRDRRVGVVGAARGRVPLHLDPDPARRSDRSGRRRGLAACLRDARGRPGRGQPRDVAIARATRCGADGERAPMTRPSGTLKDQLDGVDDANAGHRLRSIGR